jgi:hypothetical protein
MIADFHRALLAVMLAGIAIFPSRAMAQLSVPGKLMTYRTVDADSGEELLRSRHWQTVDGSAAMEIAATTYPAGTQVISECAFGKGLDRPATAFRSVMRSATGELERSDFDTFDPRYYPFVAQPITGDMQPGTCLNRRMIDFAAVLRADSATTWLWSDSGLVGVVLQGDGKERLTVPAGSFDAVRIRIDVDLSKLFPRVPELFLKLVKPHFTVWVSRAEPHYVLRMDGFGSNAGPDHKNTRVELASIEDLKPGSLPAIPSLAPADAPDSTPPLTTVNSANFAQGGRTGKVTLATGATSGGELLLTHVAFSNGLATESRTLLDHRATPVTVYLDDRSFAANAAMVRKHLLFFRQAAFPDDPKKDLPAELYGGDTTLGLVLPRLLPQDSDETIFHVMDFTGQVNQLKIVKEGSTTIALTTDDRPAVHAQLIPIVDVPLLLRPLAYFFIPSFDAYFDTDAPHRLLKFEGPLGPPGVPNATMIADENLPAANPTGAENTR